MNQNLTDRVGNPHILNPKGTMLIKQTLKKKTFLEPYRGLKATASSKGRGWEQRDHPKLKE